MYILSVVSVLVHHHRGDVTLSISAGEDERCAPELCSLTSMGPPPPVNVHIILLQLPFISNTISSKFHTCNGLGWMSSRPCGTSSSVLMADMAGVAK